MTDISKFHNRYAVQGARCKFYINGNRHFPGRLFTYNRRQYRCWETFLNSLTTSMGPTFGKITQVYTPRTGTRVTTPSVFQTDNSYVVANSKFQRLNYCEIQPLSPRKDKRPKFSVFDFSIPPPAKTLGPSPSDEKIKPVTHSTCRVSGRVKKINIKNKKIIVFPNGQFFFSPSVVVLTTNEQSSLDKTMTSIAEKVELPQGGFPDRLYTVDGQRVDNVEDLSNGGMYVALSSREKFKSGPYGPCLRMAHNNKTRLSPLVKKKSSQKGSDSDPDTSASSNTNTEAQSRKSHHKPRKPQPSNQDDNGVFHAKPAPKQKPSLVSKKEVDYDKDEGGVFKAKIDNSERTGAKEIAESVDTKTEIPVDQQEAEVVQEDEVMAIEPEQEADRDDTLMELQFSDDDSLDDIPEESDFSNKDAVDSTPIENSPHLYETPLDDQADQMEETLPTEEPVMDLNDKPETKSAAEDVLMFATEKDGRGSATSARSMETTSVATVDNYKLITEKNPALTDRPRTPEVAVENDKPMNPKNSQTPELDREDDNPMNLQAIEPDREDDGAVNPQNSEKIPEQNREDDGAVNPQNSEKIPEPDRGDDGAVNPQNSEKIPEPDRGDDGAVNPQNSEKILEPNREDDGTVNPQNSEKIPEPDRGYDGAVNPQNSEKIPEPDRGDDGAVNPQNSEKIPEPDRGDDGAVNPQNSEKIPEPDRGDDGAVNPQNSEKIPEPDRGDDGAVNPQNSEKILEPNREDDGTVNPQNSEKIPEPDRGYDGAVNPQNSEKIPKPDRGDDGTVNPQNSEKILEPNREDDRTVNPQNSEKIPEPDRRDDRGAVNPQNSTPKNEIKNAMTSESEIVMRENATQKNPIPREETQAKGIEITEAKGTTRVISPDPIPDDSSASGRTPVEGREATPKTNGKPNKSEEVAQSAESKEGPEELMITKTPSQREDEEQANCKSALSQESGWDIPAELEQLDNEAKDDNYDTGAEETETKDTSVEKWQDGPSQIEMHSEAAAAVKIQAAFRGHTTRKNIQQSKEHKAAMQIQANFRGYLTRKQLSEKREKPIGEEFDKKDL